MGAGGIDFQTVAAVLRAACKEILADGA